MAINKRGGTVTPNKAPAKASANEPESTGATNVTVSRQFTIPGDGEYESQKVGVIVSAPTHEEASSLVDQYMTLEFQRSSAQFAQFRAAADDMAAELGMEDLPEEGEEEEADGEGLGADDVRAMNRVALKKLVKENELEVDPDDFPSTKKGLADFAEAIIEAAGLGDEEEEETEEEETEEEGEDEAALTADDIMAMDRSELIALNKEHSLGVATKSYPKLKDLAAAIIEAAGLSEDEEEELEEEEETEDEEETEEEAETTADDIRAMSRKDLLALNKENELGIATKSLSDEELAEAIIEAAGLGDEEEEETEEEEEEEPAGYSRAELEGMKLADLKQIWTSWKIKDKFPTGAAPVAQKKAVNRIMTFQDTGK